MTTILGIGQVLTMPLFFASNAIYPLSTMPGWLQVAAHVNPLTYEVDALRALMLAGSVSSYGIGLDLVILAGATALLLFIGGQLYPTIVTQARRSNQNRTGRARHTRPV
jgi:ABC-2 type transport system permease protein